MTHMIKAASLLAIIGLVTAQAAGPVPTINWFPAADGVVSYPQTNGVAHIGMESYTAVLDPTIATPPLAYAQGFSIQFAPESDATFPGRTIWVRSGDVNPACGWNPWATWTSEANPPVHYMTSKIGCGITQVEISSPSPLVLQSSQAVSRTLAIAHDLDLAILSQSENFLPQNRDGWSAKQTFARLKAFALAARGSTEASSAILQQRNIRPLPLRAQPRQPLGPISAVNAQISEAQDIEIDEQVNHRLAQNRDPGFQSSESQMEEVSSGSDSDYANSWIAWFMSTKGNEYFCEIDEEYITDRFNLTGLNLEVQHYAQALDMITDNTEDDMADDVRDTIEVSARHLYGLIHARFILTSRGLAKMIDKFKKADFGRCPRVLCYGQALLPVGLKDSTFHKPVKLYCARCEDIYSPKSGRHGSIDGAYFGTTFPHMLFMVHPQLIPAKTLTPGHPSSAPSSNVQQPNSQSGTTPSGLLGGVGASQTGGPGAAAKVERYRPRIFGFMLHETAQLQRWQESIRNSQIERLEAVEAVD